MITSETKGLYEYNSSWNRGDGPAMVAFTDGRYLGATLDRNGLRPLLRYQDDHVILSSEVVSFDIADSDVRIKHRWSLVRCLFLVDFETQRIVPDDEIKNKSRR
jgi:hypothetical protein